MKLIHLSDLHLGKRLNEYSLLEDQAYILQRILGVIDGETPDGVMIAGDIYDKAVPSAEAVRLFDDFLSELAKRELKVFAISGNHDSPERIAFASRILGARGVYMSPVYDGRIRPVTLRDAYGDVDVYLLPFVKPAHIRRFFEDREITSYTDALRCVTDAMEIDGTKRNVLIAHQFVTGARRSESEELCVGGAENVDAQVFARFDYVALGHIHSPQNCGTHKIRYCGTPLKYSFSEAKDKKSVTVVELKEKGNVAYKTVGLDPLRELAELKGTYAELTLRSFYENTGLQEAYTHITLTDEEDIPDAIGKLRTIYRGLMKLDYDNARTRAGADAAGNADVENKTPFELFADFYELQNNRPMDAAQAAYMEALIEKTWENET